MFRFFEFLRWIVMLFTVTGSSAWPDGTRTPHDKR